MLSFLLRVLIIILLTCLHRRRLKERICSSYPSLSQASLDELLPSKCSLASSRVFTHSNNNVNIFIVNGEPLFFEHEANLCPTGESFHETCTCINIHVRTLYFHNLSSHGLALISCLHLQSLPCNHCWLLVFVKSLLSTS